MSHLQGHRIFLSYARSDLAFARQLRERLIAEGLDPPWHDQTHMSAGEWWDQIEEVLTSTACEHVILVLSPSALAEDRHLVVKREWKLARREGKTVLPVIAPGGLAGRDRALMPGWMNATHAFDLQGADAESQWVNFVAELKNQERQPRRPFMPPAMPEGFVARPEEFAKLKTALLDAKGNAVAITAALRGAGGFGKTVLAQALAHDDDIQDAFHDGILWVTLGERPSLVEKLADLLKTLIGEPQGFTEISTAANKLREVLAEQKCLLVIDDVWSESHLRPFADGAPFTARLVTTRRDDILPKNAMRVPVDAMKEAEAVELLSQGLGEIGATERTALRTLATERLNEWPVIIRLVNGFLRKEVERGAVPRDAIRQANDRLDRKKLTIFDRNDEAARGAAVESTVRASVDYLVEEIGRGQDPKVYNGQRYDELAVFPEDVEVPIATIARLWAGIAEVDVIDARDLLKHLYSLALLQALDLKRGTVRLHDVMRKYLTQQQTKDALKGLHHQFVEAYDAASGPDIENAEERRYFYTWFPTHLHEAGERDVLNELLLDPQWMVRKLDALESPLPLVRDCGLGQLEGHQRISAALSEAAGILHRHRDQLLPQLIGRVSATASPRLGEFLDGCKRHSPRPALIPTSATFGSSTSSARRPFTFESNVVGLKKIDDQFEVALANKRVERLMLRQAGSNGIEDHEDAITALAALPNGSVLSSSLDGTVRVWPLTSNKSSARIELADIVTSIGVLPDGGVLFGTRTGAIRRWDRDAGTAPEIGRHEGEVTALKVLQDGRALSGSIDRALRLWNLKEGSCHVLAGHTHDVTALAIVSNGLAISASADCTIWLWDLVHRRPNAVFQGHVDAVTAIATLPGDRMISASRDGSLRLWDYASGMEVAQLHGGGEWIPTLTVLCEDRAITRSSDGKQVEWDIIAGTCTPLRDAHDSVRALSSLPGGAVASGSLDGVLRLWRPKAEGFAVHQLHAGRSFTTMAAVNEHLFVAGDALGRLHWLEIVE